MIRIKKPEKIPEILETDGKAKKKEMCDAYDKGVRKFEFDKEKLYNHSTVKEILCKAQHDKCFLCEAKVTHISSGDVEHFRPKAGFRQSEEHDLQKPGYFWLAYEWSNLFFVCELCNRRYKKNLFPLADNSNRFTLHSDNLDKEEPLFINPETEKPEDYLSFRGENIYAVDDNLKGKTTIAGAGLDRPKLVGDRRNKLREIWLIYHLARNSPPTPFKEEAERLIESYRDTDNGEYTLMIRANLADEFENLKLLVQ
jgi:hypothetical protein